MFNLHLAGRRLACVTLGVTLALSVLLLAADLSLVTGAERRLVESPCGGCLPASFDRLALDTASRVREEAR